MKLKYAVMGMVLALGGCGKEPTTTAKREPARFSQMEHAYTIGFFDGVRFMVSGATDSAKFMNENMPDRFAE